VTTQAATSVTVPVPRPVFITSVLGLPG